jgi:myo-inositol-1(or 4)-monophosphatase
MTSSSSPRELVLGLARALRDEVLPELGDHAGRAHSGAGEGGDITFAIDERAEAFMERYVAERAPDVAFYSEDRGLVAPHGGASWVLVVDPIDGTRPAMAGLEAACVSVAAARWDPGRTARMGDVATGCVVEIKSGRAFVADRGGRLDPAPSLSANRDLSRMFWAYGLRGRPVRAIAEVLGELIDVSSVGGATFDLGSATYDITRIVTGQLDAYVEPGPRIVADVPGMREEFERVGGGVVLNNSPYDLAAAALILEEAGGVVTDAYGEPLGKRALLGSGAEFQISCVAAANRELHGAVVRELDLGIGRLSRASSA